MSRYIENAHLTPEITAVFAATALQTTSGSASLGPTLSGRGTTFVVKLRDLHSRSWGNQSEVVADNALDAAEWAAGETLNRLSGDRSKLRARVWETPFGSTPDVPYYVAN